MEHLVIFKSTGTKIDDTCQPVCSCGWKGQPIAAYNNWQMTLVKEQGEKHLKNCTRVQKGEKMTVEKMTDIEFEISMFSKYFNEELETVSDQQQREAEHTMDKETRMHLLSSVLTLQLVRNALKIATKRFLE